MRRLVRRTIRKAISQDTTKQYSFNDYVQCLGRGSREGGRRHQPGKGDD